MKTAFLNALGILMLAVILAVAWITATTSATEVYVVQEGQSAKDVAEELGVSAAALALANDAALDEFEPEPGTVIVVPEAPPTAREQLVVHGTGLAATVFGVLLSFWLGLIAGLVPRGYRRRILVISCILGIASYAAAMAVLPATPRLTPQFVFAAIRDGFAWAAGFPLFARVFGFKGDPLPPPPEPASQEE